MTAALRKANFYACLLDTNAFAEQVTYHPAGQPAPRTITAIVRPTQEIDQAEYLDREVQRYTVSVGKDETHAKGGVALPVAGDRIQRASETDQQALMAFTGRIIGETPHSYLLEFSRPITTQIGTDHRRR